MIPDWYQTRVYDRGPNVFPLDFYCTLLDKNIPFSRPVFGDGEFRWMVGDQELVGIRENVEAIDLLWAYRECARIARSGYKNFFVASRDRALCPGVYDGKTMDDQRIFDLMEATNMKHYKWHNAQLFEQSVAEGEFYPFLKSLTGRKIVLVAPEQLTSMSDKGIIFDHWIETFHTNQWGYDLRNKILKSIEEYGNDAIYILACGDACSYVIAKLFLIMPKSTFIDIGVAFDLLLGYRSAGWGLENNEDLRNTVMSNWEKMKI